MKDWQQVLVEGSCTLLEVLNTINRAGGQIALVVDGERRLLGTVSDGDVRRGLLNGLALSSPVAAVMCTKPTCAHANESRSDYLAIMRRAGLHQLPLLNAEGQVVGLEMIDTFVMAPIRSQWIVVMAGGLGSRLNELTRELPKPMLKVGSRPLLETIVRSFADQGFRNFYLAVNYKAEVIEDHFGNGADFGINIRYLREQRRLGTAGALGLLPDIPDEPIIVSNADLLSKTDYGYMLDQHLAHASDATMGVRDYEYQVPFGVVNIANGHVESIEEKPVKRSLISAGINVLSPKMLELVPRGEFLDMPTLFELALERRLIVRPHHITGYWLDIGNPPDYEKANIDFSDVFQ